MTAELSRRNTGPGRPCQLDADPSLIERLANHLRTGAPYSLAYGLEGLPERTFYRWLAQGQTEGERRAEGEDPDENQEIYHRFWQTLSRARAEGELHLWQSMDSAEGNRWQSQAWKLERTRKRTYGQQVQLESTGDAAAVAVLILPPVQVVDVTDHQRAALPRGTED